jgi:hypothetical protein
MKIIRTIQNRIYEIRGERVILDRDLAILYETELKTLNLSVKRNIKRLPPDFMFQLTKEEFETVRFQLELLEKSDNPLRLKNEVSKGDEEMNHLPYAFTELGVVMLSSILSSEKAITTNMAAVRTFIEGRKALLLKSDLKQLHKITESYSEHGEKLHQIHEAIENLIDEDAAKIKWEKRTQIGF